MPQFTFSCKRYADGADLSDGAHGSLPVAGPMSFGAYAAQAEVDGLPFLFWSTGRHVTNKRSVKWTFNHPELWGADWVATAWYGPAGPGGPPPGPFITANSFEIPSTALADTPIDAGASTVVNEPTAYPWNGDNHVVNDSWGAGVLHALDHMSGTLSFASWTSLIAGGDTSGEFDENDDNITATSGIFGVPAATGPDYAFAANENTLLLASYVVPVGPTVVLPKGDRGVFHPGPIQIPDPSPLRDILGKIVTSANQRVAAGVDTGPDAVGHIVASAKGMTGADRQMLAMNTRALAARLHSAAAAVEALPAQEQSPG